MLKRLIWGLAGIATFVVLWEVMVRVTGSPSLVTVQAIFGRLFFLLQQPFFRSHIYQSLHTVLVGCAIASAVGILTGIVLYDYKPLQYAFAPVLSMMRGLSALTLFPLLIIMVGLGQTSRVLVIVWTAFPAVMLSTMKALEIDESIVEASKSCGCTDFQTMIYMRIPLGLPGIFTGIKISFSAGWMAIIAAEMLGSNSGLGFYLIHSAQAFQFASMYATMFCIGIIGGISSGLLLIIQNKLNQRYGGMTNEKSGSFNLGSAVAYGVRSVLTR